MKHPGNATLFDHWLSIRNGRHIPDRNDLDPVAIRSVLGFTFMLEVDDARPATRTYPVRVSGTRLDALFGRSMKDQSFMAFWSARHADEVRGVVEDVIEEGVPVVVGGTAAPGGRDPVAVELLMLPLRSQGRTHARLICSLAPLTIPTWLGLERASPLELTTWRVIDTTRMRSPQRVAELVPTLETPEMRRHRFTVVEGGRPLDRQSQSRVKPTVSGSHTAVLSSQAP